MGPRPSRLNHLGGAPCTSWGSSDGKATGLWALRAPALGWWLCSLGLLAQHVGGITPSCEEGVDGEVEEPHCLEDAVSRGGMETSGPFENRWCNQVRWGNKNTEGEKCGVVRVGGGKKCEEKEIKLVETKRGVSVRYRSQIRSSSRQRGGWHQAQHLYKCVPFALDAIVC